MKMSSEASIGGRLSRSKRSIPRNTPVLHPSIAKLLLEKGALSIGKEVELRVIGWSGKTLSFPDQNALLNEIKSKAAEIKFKWVVDYEAKVEESVAELLGSRNKKKNRSSNRSSLYIVRPKLSAYILMKRNMPRTLKIERINNHMVVKWSRRSLIAIAESEVPVSPKPKPDHTPIPPPRIEI